MTSGFWRSFGRVYFKGDFDRRDVSEELGKFIGGTAFGGAFVGLVAGEIIDQLPYINQIVPEGFAHLGSIFTGYENFTDIRQNLEGNIDKICVGLGVVRSYLRSNQIIKEERK